MKKTITKVLLIVTATCVLQLLIWKLTGADMVYTVGGLGGLALLLAGALAADEKLKKVI